MNQWAVWCLFTCLSASCFGVCVWGLARVAGVTLRWADGYAYCLNGQMKGDVGVECSDVRLHLGRLRPSQWSRWLAGLSGSDGGEVWIERGQRGQRDWGPSALENTSLFPNQQVGSLERWLNCDTAIRLLYVDLFAAKLNRYVYSTLLLRCAFLNQ